MGNYAKKSFGDPYNHSITIRITESQYVFLTSVSQALNSSPSEYLRMCIDFLSTRFYASQMKEGDFFED